MTPEEYVELTGAAALWLPAAVYDLAADRSETLRREDLRRALDVAPPEAVDAVLEAIVDHGAVEELEDGVLRGHGREAPEWSWPVGVAPGTAAGRVAAASRRSLEASVDPAALRAYAQAAGPAVLWLPAALYASVAYADAGWGPTDRDELVADFAEHAAVTAVDSVVDVLLGYGAFRQERSLRLASPLEDPDDGPMAALGRRVRGFRRWLEG